MALPLKLDSIEELPRTPASNVKKIGWRGLMKTVTAKGRMLVTNHNTPEAVILSIDDYDALIHAAQENIRDDSVLDSLREDFDVRLASLHTADAGKRLRDVMRDPARLDGKVKAGSGH